MKDKRRVTHLLTGHNQYGWVEVACGAHGRSANLAATTTADLVTCARCLKKQKQKS